MTKHILDVSAESGALAPYTSISDIPSNRLTRGSTVRIYPATYSAVSASYDDIAFKGMGDREDVVINGFTLGGTSANTVTFRNLTVDTTSLTILGNATVKAYDCIFKGSSVDPSTNTAAVILGQAGEAYQGSFRAERCEFNTAAAAVKNHSVHASANVELMYCDTRGCDRGILSNSNVVISYSQFPSSNAYVASLVSGTQSVVTTTLSTGAANAWNTVETVKSAIS